ncbi:EamA family transporter (plasmid) [Brucella anthropi]|uniref:EamA family transporter n=1 Tax=Brucella anthropi TaxID=529 RepID=UPI00188CA482|nr:EamA family transporter [Brucella anthropi]QPA29866.1 EamA family transporter [Brucella anthropi]
MIAQNGSINSPDLNVTVVAGVAFVLMATFINALGSVISKILLDHLTVSELALARVTVTFLVLLTIMLICKPSALRLSRQEIPALVIYGLAGMVLSPLMFFHAIARLPVGLALVFEYTAPLLVVLYLRIFHVVSVPVRVLLGILVCLAGLATITMPLGAVSISASGFAFGIGAAFALAGVYLAGSSASRRRTPLAVATFGYLVGTVAIQIVNPIWTFPFSTLVSAVQISLGGSVVVETRVWMVLLAIGSLFSALPTFLVLKGISFLGPARASALSMTEPVFSFGLGWLLINEYLTLRQIIGSFIVIFGLLLQNAGARRR